MSNPITPLPLVDPWRDAPPVCRVYSSQQTFRKLLSTYLGDAVRFTESPELGPREALLVDCTESADTVREARGKFPSHPAVAVLGEPDSVRIIEALANGADGVIALTDAPSAWRECLHVVLGGGRWLGGPGLDVSLEHKYASYDIATHDRHAGEVTVRTRLFIKNRLADKSES